MDSSISRASSVTVSGDQRRDLPAPINFEKRLIVAIDFDTTYSAVSYVILDEFNDVGFFPTRVSYIHNYPGNTNTTPGDEM
jgi:hypothetical protein